MNRRLSRRHPRDCTECAGERKPRIAVHHVSVEVGGFEELASSPKRLVGEPCATERAYSKKRVHGETDDQSLKGKIRRKRHI